MKHNCNHQKQCQQTKHTHIDMGNKQEVANILLRGNVNVVCNMQKMLPSKNKFPIISLQNKGRTKEKYKFRMRGVQPKKNVQIQQTNINSMHHRYHKHPPASSSLM